MDAFNNKCKEKLRQELSAVGFTPEQKEALCASLIRERQLIQGNRWQRLLGSWREFWDSTYEISLAPAAAAVCILLVVLGVKLLPNQFNPPETTYFIRQTDSGLEIIPLERVREGQ